MIWHMGLLNPKSPGCSHGVYTVDRWRSERRERTMDLVAEEVPVALVYNGSSHAVMLATPRDLEDFAVGFSLSEAVLGGVEELYDVSVLELSEGMEVRMAIAPSRWAALRERHRNLAGRTGCGLCGSESLKEVVRETAVIKCESSLSGNMLAMALEQIPGMQPLNSVTGAVHGAAWVRQNGSVEIVREDVGRHNALDKLIGAMARRRADFSRGLALVTSRASYEMVQKAATVGITCLAAISAPTGLAIRLAEKTGLTLIAFARGRDFVVYANPQRVTEMQR